MIAEVSPPSANAGRWVLFATILASSMAFIDGTALNVAMPALQANLRASGASLLWIINGYALMLASGILVGGSLGDHYGRKRVYVLGILIFAGASLLCGLAPSTGFLIAARVLQGVGGALMVPGSLALISCNFEPGRRGRAIGLWSTFVPLTNILGPVLGGFLASRGLWRGIFFINLPLAALAIGALILRVPESRDETLTGRLDYGGALLASLGLAGLTYGFIEGPSQGWTAPAILIALLGGLACFAIFVVVERRVAEPLVPFRLFRSRTFTGANLMTLALYGAVYANVFFLPLNLVQAQNYGQAAAGFSLLPITLVIILLSRRMGGLVDRFGPRLPLTIGPLITGAGFLLLALPALTNGASDYWRTYLPGLLVYGLGMGITVAPLTTAVMGAVSSNHAGVASGINNAVSRVAGVLALAVLGGLALARFRHFGLAHTASLNQPPEALAALKLEAARLGDAKPPPGLDTATSAQVQTAIRLALVDVFRVIALVCAGLAWLSAALAWLTIDNREVSPGD
jgi:EmrB/QacA subfamily drug resistance transporter